MTRMARLNLSAGLVVLTIAASACGARAVTPTQPSATAPPAVTAYLDQVMSVMEARSINRGSIDWQAFRAAVQRDAATAQTIADLQPAIRTALGLLGDNHSVYISASGATISNSSVRCTAASFEPPLLPAGIGYVRIPAFTGSVAAATEFADAVQRTITRADAPELAGWIVDLRGNGGGNMWPMIAGAGPVLAEGVVGYFVAPDGGEVAWEYRDGASLLAGAAAVSTTVSYHLAHEHPKVAVLTDGGVASSGEALAIAFRGRPDTRSFGLPTCGLSTANATVPMSDGATLYLTVSVMADRTRTRYGRAVVPDETVVDPNDAVRRAVAWLRAGQ
jgi:hypothetical protein